eukprot:CAMPEP_0113576168 /NCGR_PEP_ID=MMETSP0015_2-20120614/28134_1 /TAXON_ID=2838 /ORGANISM="Odontella" /LENGTH=184 /DNA_ID=CAMNT_0000479549 /DNA_START=159 /DNA_END=713 /DNA_ORIENTATION=- /assembly_acc=CAM_ASM_000160
MADSGYYDTCPTIATFMGFAGVMSAIVFANVGAAYGTGKAGVGIMTSCIRNPELIWRNLIPIIMAGVNGIYGLITSIILMGAIQAPGDDGYNKYSLYTGCAHLAAGLACGLSGLGSGMCIGIAGDASVRSCGAYEWERKKPTKGKMMGMGGKKKGGGGDKLGNLALYGLITSIIISQQVFYCGE